jgi:hypothetical protein
MAIFSSPSMRSFWACLLGAASLSLLAVPLAANASGASSTPGSTVRTEKPEAFGRKRRPRRSHSRSQTENNLRALLHVE